MARMRSDTRTILGLAAAVAIAPYVLGAATWYGLFPFDLPGSLEMGLLAIPFGFPFSLAIACLVGAPAILLAHKLRVRSFWYYAAVGLVAGYAGTFAAPGKVTKLSDVTVYVADGLVASLVYWLVAERGPFKDRDTDV